MIPRDKKEKPPAKLKFWCRWRHGPGSFCGVVLDNPGEMCGMHKVEDAERVAKLEARLEREKTK